MFSFSMIDGEKVLGTEQNMRPGHSHCQSTGSVNEARATAMWGIGIEPRLHSEVYGSAGAQRSNTKGNVIKR